MDKSERDRLRALCEAEMTCQREADKFIAAARTAIPALLDAMDAAEAERDDLQASFDLRWKADMRGIKQWHAAGGDELTWPDHADLVVWLLETRDALRAKLDAAEADKQKLLDNARPALEHVYDECRRATVAAIVRRLRQLLRMTPAIEVIEREFLEKE